LAGTDGENPRADRKRTVGPEELQRRIDSLERRELQLQMVVLFFLGLVVAGLLVVTLPGSSWQVATGIKGRDLPG
jgi:hypothetical protein